MKISKIYAREILDSRANPTVEVEVTTLSGISARAAVPSGASTGSYEAVELRDRDKSRYGGRGVLSALKSVECIIAPEILGMSVFDQRAIDRVMIEADGTENKSNLGANAILATSLAVARLAAKLLRMPLFRYIGGVDAHILPVPMFNIINGGRHSDAPIAFQEFMIRPVGAQSFSEAMRMGATVFYALREELQRRGLSTAVGDEGGFAPALDSAEDALQTLIAATEKAGYVAGRDITFALDCAASEFYNDGYDYRLFESSSAAKLTTDEQVRYIADLVDCYPIDSVEDPLAEDDWRGWQALTKAIGNRCQIVGDDLFVTNPKRIARGIKEHCANAVLIKPNQIGTLTQTIEAVRAAQNGGYKAILSHRSGETEDTTIADIAVALGAGQIKSGSLSRTERTAKYNHLLRIEEWLGKDAIYAGVI
ncbi:MAG: phosphopyruvate hydratase [Alistipes sp.]|nr:phosphopyruvate hydratase [Alistipes sp.]